MSGFELTREPGAAAWFELHTPAYDEAVAFCRYVFGWDAHAPNETPEFRYVAVADMWGPGPDMSATAGGASYFFAPFELPCSSGGSIWSGFE